MEYKKLASTGPVLFKPKVFSDGRGYFMETFRQNEFEEHCGNYTFVQDNQSKSRGGVIRGLHYQLNKPQGKLVRAIKGRIFDVAVDLRKSSPDFGRSYGVFLDTEMHEILWIPPGFAHGFAVLSDEAEFVYKCTAYYDPKDEYCLIWNDPELKISWPLLKDGPLLSEKDMRGLPLAKCPVFR